MLQPHYEDCEYRVVICELCGQSVLKREVRSPLANIALFNNQFTR